MIAIKTGTTFQKIYSFKNFQKKHILVRNITTSSLEYAHKNNDYVHV